MIKYKYDGPVMVCNTLVADHWKGTTLAKSEKKAKSNLAYQFKKNNNLVPGSKVDLPGELTIIQRLYDERSL